MKIKITTLIAALMIAAVSLPAAIVLPKQLLAQGKGISASSAQRTSAAGFVIKEYEGKIGIFQIDSDRPIQVLEVYVETLPDTEQQRLKKGIVIWSEKDLRSLIEAYTS